jgi:hypothetical protein
MVDVEINVGDDLADAENAEPIEGEIIEAETLEVVADASVEIAEIEGGVQIALAEIRAETELAHIEAFSDAERLRLSTEIEECQRTITDLRSTVMSLEAELLLTRAPSTPPDGNPPNPPPDSESLEVTPASLEAPETALPVREPALRPVRYRLI